jgi:hypothetical protein
VSSLFDVLRKKGTHVSLDGPPESGHGSITRVGLVLLAGAVLVLVWELTGSAEVAVGASALAVQLAT